ncbi:MAG: Ig-like domain-containing protein, partial [Candidatus Krumholzibacteriota bacterium]
MISDSVPNSITFPADCEDPYPLDPAIHSNVTLSVDGTTITDGAFYYDMTLQQKYWLFWDNIRRSTKSHANGVYVSYHNGSGSLGDSGGRTPSSLTGLLAYYEDFDDHTTDNKARAQQLEDQIIFWQENHLRDHAFNAAGALHVALGLPQFEDRNQRYFLHKWKLFHNIPRQPDESLNYVGGPSMVDPYINWDFCVHTYFAFAGSVAHGGLPHIPGFDTNRIFVHIREPWLEWPDVSAMKIRPSTTNYTFDASVIDAEGDALPLADCTSTWSVVSGPVTNGIIADPSVLAATMTFPQDGTYQVRLDVSHGGLSTYEVIDMEVTTPVAPTPPSILTQPVDQSVPLGGTATFSISAAGPEPAFYQWRLNGVSYWPASSDFTLTLDNVGAGNVGLYDCVYTTSAGELISDTAQLTISDPGYGTDQTGGLWQEVYDSIGGSTVAELTSAENYPYASDSSGVITNAETGDQGDSYGQRWTGWVVPTNSADYRFFVASDDQFELRLSTDESPAAAQLIASGGTVASRAWESTTPSGWISLLSGERYYIELLHKENAGADHAAIAWQKFGDPAPTNGVPPIAATNLEYRIGGILPGLDDPPLAVDDALQSFQGDPVTVDVLDNDIHSLNLWLTVSQVSQASHGAVTFSGREVTYTPNGGYKGADSFTYVATTPAGLSDTGLVSVAVYEHLFLSVTNFDVAYIPGTDNGTATVAVTSGTLNSSPEVEYTFTITEADLNGGGGSDTMTCRMKLVAESTGINPKVRDAIGNFGASSSLDTDTMIRRGETLKFIPLEVTYTLDGGPQQAGSFVGFDEAVLHVKNEYPRSVWTWDGGTHTSTSADLGLVVDTLGAPQLEFEWVTVGGAINDYRIRVRDIAFRLSTASDPASGITNLVVDIPVAVAI